MSIISLTTNLGQFKQRAEPDKKSCHDDPIKLSNDFPFDLMAKYKDLIVVLSLN